MKIFACSDIHSAYTPWVQALKKAGFDENNPEHIIIVCGDLLDRMNETAETLEFALSLIRKDRLIYIFVHSWIPTNVHYEGKMKPWYQQGKTFTWMEDWRNANDVEWESATWGNPLCMAQDGLNKTGKIIIAGHWHSSAGWAWQNKTFDEFGVNAVFDPFYYKDKLIMIDRCTAHTGEVNVVVLEDDFLE